MIRMIPIYTAASAGPPGAPARGAPRGGAPWTPYWGSSERPVMVLSIGNLINDKKNKYNEITYGINV